MVQVGKLLRNGQSQTGGVVLGRGGGVEIPVKYGGLILRCNAAARVPDAHQTRNGGEKYIQGKMDEAIAAGALFKCDTLEELADKLGFTGEAKDTFLATVDRYNELYDKQEDEDFGKPAYRLSAIRTAPFYGCWLGASLLTTEQGIAINEKGQALDNDNKPMPGLYITGDMSGSFFANNYPCLMAGVAMGRTLTFAMKAVKQMAGLE